MISEEKKFKLLELVPTTISVHRSWDCCNYWFDKMCIDSVKLITSLIDIDDDVLRDAIFQGGGPEPKETFLSHGTMPGNDEDSQSIKCAMFLDDFLKANQYISQDNYFIQRFCLHGEMPSCYESNSHLKESEIKEFERSFRNNDDSRINMDQWYIAMEIISSEILIALSGHCYNKRDGIQSPQYCIAELLYWLNSAIDDILTSGIFIAPYILNPGEGWAYGFENNEIENTYGQLELKPLIKWHQHKKYSVDCCFSFLQGSKIKKVSWVIEKDFFCRSYREELAATWSKNSGLYLDYPEKNKPAFLKDFSDSEFEAIPDYLPNLYSIENCHDIAKELDLLYEYIWCNRIIEYSTVHKISSVFDKIEHILYETLGCKGKYKAETGFPEVLKKVRSKSGSSHISRNLLETTIECLLQGETKEADIMRRGGFAMSGNLSVVLKVLYELGYCSKQEDGVYIQTPEGRKLSALIHSKS